MLVLTRRPGQALAIGDSVEVTVVRIEGDRVVLGIKAPSNVSIVRSELIDAVSAEVEAARGSLANVQTILATRMTSR